MNFSVKKAMCSGGSRISPRRGAPTYDFAKFSQKLHEIERIWAPGGARPSRPPLDPPLMCTMFWVGSKQMMSQVWLTRLFHNFSKNIIFHLQILFHFDLPNIFPSSTFVWTLSQFYRNVVRLLREKRKENAMSSNVRSRYDSSDRDSSTNLRDNCSYSQVLCVLVSSSYQNTYVKTYIYQDFIGK